MMMDDDDAAQSWVAAAHDLRGTNDPCEFMHRFGRMEMIHMLTLIARDVNRATFNELSSNSLCLSFKQQYSN